MAYAYPQLKSAFGSLKILIILPRVFTQFPSAYSSCSLQESIPAAVEAKAYEQIPDILNTSKNNLRNANPFKFLSSLSENHRVHIVDEMLQAFIPIRPRNKMCLTYSYLLSHILETPNPLSLAFAILQRTLRSGCLPFPQTNLLLSQAWIKQSSPVSKILLEMNSIGYSPDCGTCNFLILSLCKTDQLVEAVKVVRDMCKAGCVPDLDSYGALVGQLSENRLTGKVVEMVKEMVSVHGLHPRQDMVMKAVRVMCANRDGKRAVEMIEFLETEDVNIGFEPYELVLESCLECHQFVLGGKFVIRMTEKGFIPYIRVRQRLVEGLVYVGEIELAAIVRQRFSELRS